MASGELKVEFEEDPLLFLDQAFPEAASSVWLPWRRLCLADPEASKAVLTNSEGLYEEHADFFKTRRGIFGPREVQVRIARGGRTLLRSYLDANAGRLAESVRPVLVGQSAWPDAGNWLMYRHLGDLLLAPGSPPPLRQLVEEIIQRAVLAGARQRYSLFTRTLFRLRVGRQLKQAIEQRRKRRASPPADLLDVVVSGAEPDAPAAELAEVFLSFVFAVVGSLGFVLGWSVYLLGTHPGAHSKPGWVIREALRLWPVAWFLAATPTQRHEVVGVTVTPKDEVIVCPYAVQRNPRHWDEPAEFQPERWADAKGPQAFIPFGWGPHSCPASVISMELVEEILQLMLDGHRLSATPHDARPCINAAVAPPRFTMSRVAARV